jgi:hypothetical protein
MRATIISLCLALLCNCCHAQEVTIRVIKSNGRGLPNERVAVQFLYDEPSRSSPPLKIKTDGAGEARFNLPQPVLLVWTSY